MRWETRRPVRVRWPRRAPPSLLIEAAANEIGERRHGALRLAPGGDQVDGGAGAGGKHHESHDGAAGGRAAVLAHCHLGVELPGELDEAGGGAGMQTALVTDGDRAPDLAGVGCAVVRVVHPRASARSWDATLMYLRPASCAPRTALARPSVWRRLASLISIGWFVPAVTAIFGRSLTVLARMTGVPPNISFRTP